MTNVLEINGLSKTYSTFKLNGIGFVLPAGCIMGFMGENGAGKSTTIKSILGLVKADGGSIRLWGRERNDSLMDDIGFVLDNCPFADNMNALQVGKTLRYIYKNWDMPIYMDYLKTFSLDPKKKIKDYSRGMQVKLCIATALSHHCKLLILDEPTSGLDPVIRDQILEILQEFIQDEQNAVFLSSHITGDLEKICDYICFIHKGSIKLSGEKDTLLEEYGMLKCGKKDFGAIDPSAVYGCRKSSFCVEALVKRDQVPKNGFTIDPATLEDIMLFTIKGEEAQS